MKMENQEIEYSIVVPVYNENGNISILDKEIKESMKKITKNYEIIYINDGSTDKTYDELKKLKRITIINLKRNYGQATALDAGFKHAKGKYIISMDGDGQNNPKDIPRLIEKLKEDNLDVVCGYRKKRKDKNGIKLLTKIGRHMRKKIININDTGCTLRVYTREAAKSLDIQGEMHRYIAPLLQWKGFKVGEIIVDDRKRINGESKYNYSKAFRGFVDLIYIWFIQKYSQRPLHIFGYASVLSFFAGSIIMLWMIIGALFFNYDLSNNAWFIISVFLLLTSIIFFSFGMIFDMLIRIKLDTSICEKRYYIKNIDEN